MPKHLYAIAGECGRVMTEPHMNPAVILSEILDTMRHDHATSQTGEIMIKHWERLLAVHLPIAIERS